MRYLGQSGLLSILFTMLLTTAAWPQQLNGSYVSLDGQLEHEFLSSGDYTGIARDPDASGAGVFRQGPDTCWLNLNDGSKKTGNLLLYVGEVQCCLSVVAISDKLGFTRIWIDGTGFGYRMCTNQVFRKAN